MSSSPLRSVSTVFCGSCRRLAPWENAAQLIPCLHTICIPCVEKQLQKSQICPVMHCYSPIAQPPDQKWSTCQNEGCQRKLSFAADIATAVCLHELCGKCFEDAYKSDPPVCPVLNCGVALDEEEREKCAGPCGASLNGAKLVSLPCCQTKMCQPCVDKRTGGKSSCSPRKCQSAERRTRKGKKRTDFAKVPCQGQPECEGEVLRNFPSESECEHAVCLTCLGLTLSECESQGISPICPAESCRLPYRCETVLALKAHFPERANYFNRFDLEAHFSMEALKDDTLMHIRAKGTEDVTIIEIKTCFCEDDDNVSSVEFFPEGSLGDLLREIRRVLKVMPWDKVYGYFLRDTEGSEDKPLVVKPETIMRPIAQMGITKVSLILLDITGIVTSKKKPESMVERKKSKK